MGLYGAFYHYGKAPTQSFFHTFPVFHRSKACGYLTFFPPKAVFFAFVEKILRFKRFSSWAVEKLSTFCQLLFNRFYRDILPRHNTAKPSILGHLKGFPQFPQPLIRLRLDFLYHSFLFSPARSPAGPLGSSANKRR